MPSKEDMVQEDVLSYEEVCMEEDVECELREHLLEDEEDEDEDSLLEELVEKNMTLKSLL